jgi:hypothetical protein
MAGMRECSGFVLSPSRFFYRDITVLGQLPPPQFLRGDEFDRV